MQYFSIQRFAALLISLFLLVYLFIIGKTILAPLLFAIFFAFLLKPSTAKVESWVKNRVAAILITISASLLIVLGAIMAFSVQLGEIINNFGDIQASLESGISKVLRWSGQIFGMSPDRIEQFLSDNAASMAAVPTEIITSGIGSSMAVISSILLCILFTFFLLLYRTSFYNFMLFQFNDDQRERGGKIIRRIEKISKKYLQGLLLVVVILATLNSLGLYIIGIKLAFFWGLLGACLAIIPFVGTILGGTLPFIYALASYGLSWQPLAVVIFYILVQSLEGNIISPKIIGSSVRINPFIAIIALLLGAAIWGVAGMILALPLIAITKIIFSHIEVLQPVSELLGDKIYTCAEVFEEKYNEDKYRLAHFFWRAKQKK